jgi:hypothetical protein
VSYGYAAGASADQSCVSVYEVEEVELSDYGEEEEGVAGGERRDSPRLPCAADAAADRWHAAVCDNTPEKPASASITTGGGGSHALWGVGGGGGGASISCPTPHRTANPINSPPAGGLHLMRGKPSAVRSIATPNPSPPSTSFSSTFSPRPPDPGLAAALRPRQQQVLTLLALLVQKYK